jgi:hypothetical protein
LLADGIRISRRSDHPEAASVPSVSKWRIALIYKRNFAKRAVRQRAVVKKFDGQCAVQHHGTGSRMQVGACARTDLIGNVPRLSDQSRSARVRQGSVDDEAWDDGLQVEAAVERMFEAGEVRIGVLSDLETVVSTGARSLEIVRRVR